MERFLSIFILSCITETHEVATSIRIFHRSRKAVLDKNLFVLFFLPSMVICPDIPSSSLMSRKMTTQMIRNIKSQRLRQTCYGLILKVLIFPVPSTFLMLFPSQPLSCQQYSWTTQV